MPMISSQSSEVNESSIFLSNWKEEQNKHECEIENVEMWNLSLAGLLEAYFFWVVPGYYQLQKMCLKHARDLKLDVAPPSAKARGVLEVC
mmetsp:Transcript_31359/g.70469  ORF Transcript_31359/g.70469 Transcript_31359/m.70469 type:complete len:90 (+) Transcript_31359:424-693(+)